MLYYCSLKQEHRFNSWSKHNNFKLSCTVKFNCVTCHIFMHLITAESAWRSGQQSIIAKNYIAVVGYIGHNNNYYMFARG